MKTKDWVWAMLAMLAVLAAAGCAAGSLRHLVPETSVEVQQSAVQALILRSIGQYADRFNVSVNASLPFRSFQISTHDGFIHIAGSDGVSVAKGFHHALKYYWDRDVTWTNVQVDMSSTEMAYPLMESRSASEFIYYQNVCTWSYSFAWWSWSTWRSHIDWMAMMGVSLTIAPIQEQIWHQVYSDLGLTEDEISEHFAGPAFQAWQRMGNIKGWGGPLPASYRHMQLLLQQQIINAQRELGMSVALPAFAGHVPTALQRLYPDVQLTPVERWNRFPDQYCCDLFLDPNQTLFETIAGQFLRLTIATYGSNRVFFADPFNEIQPRLPTADYMRQTARSTYDSMRQVDPSAVWLLQGWMFVKNIFWTDELIEAFLTAVPQGKLLVLDLQSEQFPQYQRTHSYHGQPFIWCMLHNFGGTLGMHGSVNTVNSGIRMARNMANSSMVGVGISPEGINQNYAMYALALERGWQRDDFDLTAWFNTYANVRYGGYSDRRLRDAWQLMRGSVYSYYGLKKMRGKYAITRRPGLNLDIWTWYNATDIEAALGHLLAAGPSTALMDNNNYQHDLVDVTRQMLQNIADRLYVNLVSAYQKKQSPRLTYIADQFERLFNDLEEILATKDEFLLGRWLYDAREMDTTEGKFYEFNALNQITAWGPTGQVLDYASKQWSGMVRHYYWPRWHLFLRMLQASLVERTPFNATAFKATVSTEIEIPFANQSRTYPRTGRGYVHSTAQRIYDEWTKRQRIQIHSHYVRLDVRRL